VVLVLAVVLGVVLSKPGQQATRAVDRLLDPPPPPLPRGVGAQEIVLGMASPFTGANRELGRAMRAGVEAAFAEVNADGGVHGRRLRLVAVDDGYEPPRTAAAMKQLLDRDRVFAVVGNVGTPTAAVSAPLCDAAHVVFFGALSGGDLLRRTPPDRYVFNFRPSYAQETAAAVRWLVEARRVAPGRIGVFAQQDEFGEAGWRGAAAELARRGVDTAKVFRAGYRRNSDEVGEAVAALKRAHGVDAVVMVATYRAAAAFIRRARDAGLRQITTNVSAVDANTLAEELAGDPRAGAVMVTQVVPSPASHLAGVQRFQDAMARHGGGERPGFLSLEGWIVGHLLADGLERTGKDVDGEKLVAALEGLRDVDLGIGTRLSFGPDRHQASDRVWGTLLQPDGTWRPVELP
jgi:ABC-type branched-subunit amino acid transport system substrate-binding protein